MGGTSPKKTFTLVSGTRYRKPRSVNSIIEEASYSGIILPSTDWHTLTHHGNTARITYRVRVQCDIHYFNSTCTKFCRPRDDKFGHYHCDNNGDKMCIGGWRGANCEIAVCKTGCHPIHGKCDQPGGCDSSHFTHLILRRHTEQLRNLVNWFTACRALETGGVRVSQQLRCSLPLVSRSINGYIQLYVLYTSNCSFRCVFVALPLRVALCMYAP
uniref:Delta-like protein n=1 Tax=Timema bartmani TaxID=61472 RepID=A0A7R9EW33_9NEOP|nr:unnamed protein product [Timema bartmani]